MSSDTSCDEDSLNLLKKQRMSSKTTMEQGRGRTHSARCVRQTPVGYGQALGSSATDALPVASMDEDSPLPSPPPRHNSLQRTLDTLRSPFRSGSPFHIPSLKRQGSGKFSVSDSENTRPARTMRKRNKKNRDTAGEATRATEPARSADPPGVVPSSSGDKKKKGESLLHRMGSIGRKHRAGTASPAPEPALPQPADTEESTVESAPTSPPSELVTTPDPEIPAMSPEPVVPAITPEPPSSPEPETESPIAVTHPVSTRLFTKAAWMRTKSHDSDIDRPVEPVQAPSPDTALRRRLHFVSQASTFFDEDEGEERGEEEAGSLEEVVKMARARLGVHSPSPAPSHDTEEEDVMPAYGDLMEPQPSTSHASPTSERREHLYKILVIGELGTGKTSIIKRYVHQFFSQHYRATIGVDFALKVLNWDANTIIRLQLWDIAGQERFGNMTRVYYKEAVGAFIVFDVSRVATFDAVVKWKNDLDSKVQLPDGSPIPCILLANKCDQQKEGIVNSPAKMEEYCREKGFAGWFETSAKENINIEEAARSLVNKILLNDKLLQSNDSKDADRIALDHKIANGENSRDGGSKSCAC